MLHTMETDCRTDRLAPRQARLFVAAAIHSWGLADLAERAGLLTSEIVTHTMVHTDCPVHLVVESHSSSVLVEIKTVASHVQVVEGEEVGEADHGRGMVLLDALSDRWGWWEADGGKVIWFALSAA